MNVDNELYKHDPYDIEDISSITFDLEFEDMLYDLPNCIICRLTELELDETLYENEFCPCKFYYHDSCYEEWIQYKKSNKCLICEKDISSNYVIEEEIIPPPRIRRQRFIISQRERRILRRLRIDDRQPDLCDGVCNIICCRSFERINDCVTWFQVNEDDIGKCLIAIICAISTIGAMMLIYIAVAAPWIFNGSRV